MDAQRRMRDIPRALVWSGVAALTFVACLQDFGQYQFGRAEDDGGGGAAGAGGIAGMGGMMVGCATVADCDEMTTDCTSVACVDTMCVSTDLAANTVCDENGGSVCDGMGTCVECNNPSHCPGGGLCVNHQCQPATCTDGLINQDETDADCGGLACPPCANGDACIVATDCASNFCDDGMSIGGMGGMAAGGMGGMAGGGMGGGGMGGMAGGGMGGMGGAGGDMCGDGGFGPGTCAACDDDCDCAAIPNQHCDLGNCVPN